jgi:hypothetical protein
MDGKELAGRSASPFRVFKGRGGQFMMDVKSTNATMGVQIARDTINVGGLRSDLDAAMAKSSECKRMDAVKSLIGITGDIVKAEISGKPAVFSSNNVAEFSLKDKLNSTLRIDYLIRRYGKAETREALTELVNGMIAENRPAMIGSNSGFALRR